MEVQVVRSFSSDPPVAPGDILDIPDDQRALQLIEQRYVTAQIQKNARRRSSRPEQEE